MDLGIAWEHHAAQWIDRARAPGHDAFWHGTWPALRELLPPPGGAVIDLGCGEGRLGRLLQAAGFRFAGVDRSPTLVRAAATVPGAFPVALADARRLAVRQRQHPPDRRLDVPAGHR